MLIAVVAVALSTAFIVWTLSHFLPSRFQRSGSGDAVSVTILVLGDIGRSPRMQYHALSIAKHGGHVQLVGYAETSALDELQALDNVTIVPIPSPPRLLQTGNQLLFLLTAPIKVGLQVWMLWWTLCYSVKPAQWLLIQNPPSIPALAIGALVCFCRGQKMIIDWHNFGWSILALKLGHSHLFVRMSALYESIFARAADAHFAVTDAMAKQLRSSVSATAPILVLHDRPAEIFQPLTESQRSSFLQRYHILAPFLDALVSGKARLLVSSTSWTADEDFSVFLHALRDYSSSSPASSQLPELLVVITGKGPLQTHYLREIDRMEKNEQLSRVKIYTDWLSFTDYAQLLGSADLGVSLHTSSSGVDLPMKVVDMFGAALPVLGWDKFAAWPELVTEGVNGRGFSSAEQMTAILAELFSPANSSQLVRLKQGALKESQRRWDDEWDPVAGKFLGLVI